MNNIISNNKCFDCNVEVNDIEDEHFNTKNHFNNVWKKRSEYNKTSCKYICIVCNISYCSNQSLQRHYTSNKHNFIIETSL